MFYHLPSQTPRLSSSEAGGGLSSRNLEQHIWLDFLSRLMINGTPIGPGGTVRGKNSGNDFTAVYNSACAFRESQKGNTQLIRGTHNWSYLLFSFAVESHRWHGWIHSQQVETAGLLTQAWAPSVFGTEKDEVAVGAELSGWSQIQGTGSPRLWLTGSVDFWLLQLGLLLATLWAEARDTAKYPTMHKVAHMPTFHKELSGLTYQLMPWLSKISQWRQLLEGPFWMFSPLPGMTCTYIQSFLFPPKDDYNWHTRADGSSFFSSLICWSSEVLKSWMEGWVVQRLGSSSINSNCL